MKSIMEEASSIMKAIEKGWQTAGKPKEFTVKIFEEPQKNFIGMTVKPAKVALIFSEAPLQQEKGRKGKPTEAREERQRPQERRERPQRQPKEPITATPKEEIKRPEKKAEPTQTAAERLEKLGPVWTDDMIDATQNWLKEMLDIIDIKKPFTASAERFHLKIQFSEPVHQDPKREKQFFSSISHLLLTMLKRQYKRPLKGYKIVLTGS
jgi:predicted RNA-binding protein Jag